MPLIITKRHTAADLRVWAEREQTDHVRERDPEPLNRKIKRSVGAIKDFLAAGTAYVGWSGGKDSTVVAHLTRTIDPTAPVVWLRIDPWPNPETGLVSGRLSTPIIEHIETVDSARLTTQDWLTTYERAWDLAWLQGLWEIKQQFGPRYISGIRADESRDRARRCAQWGESTTNTCAPLAWWSVDDVYQYLYRFKLPIHPAYGYSGGGSWDRTALRVDAVGLYSGIGMGRKSWEAIYYPEQLAAIDQWCRQA
mgnify:CR=1 FL=1